MKTEFKAKYLQHLAKKNKDGGFTLIELLVVIIIVGVLAAIALPSFLNQIGKARGSEAKSNLGTINRAQQSYRLENSTLAPNLTNLDAKISGKFYTYAIGATSANAATATASRVDTTQDLKEYSAAVAQTLGNAAASTTEFFGSVICESVENNALPAAGTVPTVTGVAGTCPAGSTLVE